MLSYTDYWFIDHEKIITINAIIKNGKLIDWSTEQWIDLPDWARVKLTIPQSYLTDDIIKYHEEPQEFKLLEKNSELYFKLNKPNRELRNGEWFSTSDQCWEYKVKILGDLIMEKKGNKLGTLLPVLCEVYNVYNEVITPATSLNQAYTLTSVLVRPDAKAHNANVFKVFTYDWIELNKLRYAYNER